MSMLRCDYSSSIVPTACQEDKPGRVYYSLDVPPPVVCMLCVYSTG